MMQISTIPHAEALLARILIIDDDEGLRQLLTDSLCHEGYQCTSWPTGGEGLASHEREPFDLALVDLRLPDMDGADVVRQLKASVADQSFFPVILITGVEHTEERIRGFNAGCDDFLSKPINLTELNARVESLLTRRAQRAELAAANAELLVLHERKKVLASLVVHDLRNPLSALQGNIDLLAEEIAEHPELEMAADIIGDCRVLSAKALSMVAGLLDVEELEEGLLVADPTEVEVAGFVERAASYHWATVRARSLTLEFAIEPNLRGRFDADLVGRLVENLLDNAVRYAPRKGRVEVSAVREGGDLVFRVGNDGPPVPASEREVIFGRFYRIEARRSGAHANRGLGLYFCQLVAEAHGGSIDVGSHGLMSASFMVRLPQP